MVKKLFIILTVLIVIFTKAGAQSTEHGIWSEIGLNKRFGRLDVSLTGEMRNSDFLSQVTRYGIGMGVSYNIFKPVSIGLSYNYYNFYDSEFSDYQPRQRYNLFIQGEQKFGRFSISLRERLQRTIKDERGRVTETGLIDNYKVNPEYAWRNRIKLKYHIPNFPVIPAFSVESFYQLNNPDGNKFHQVRYILSLNYKFSKSQRVEIYGLFDQEIHVDNPVNRRVLGVGYYISFK